MSERVWRSGFTALIAGVVALIAAVIRPDDRGLVLDVYLLLVGGLALSLLVRTTASALPGAGRSTLERVLRAPRPRGGRPEALASLERMVLLATETAFEVHYRLRPVLREIAAYRLSSRLGIDLDREPEAARRALGPDAWEIVRPDRAPPAERLGPGLPLADLRAAVEGLESI